MSVMDDSRFTPEELELMNLLRMHKEKVQYSSYLLISIAAFTSRKAARMLQGAYPHNFIQL